MVEGGAVSHLVVITLPYACAAVIVRGDTVVQTAPIFNWMLDKNLDEVRSWVERKDGTVAIQGTCDI